MYHVHQTHPLQDSGRGAAMVSEQRLHFKSHTLETSGLRTSSASQGGQPQPCSRRPVSNEGYASSLLTVVWHRSDELSTPQAVLVATTRQVYANTAQWSSPPRRTQTQRALYPLLPLHGAHPPRTLSLPCGPRPEGPPISKTLLWAQCPAPGAPSRLSPKHLRTSPRGQQRAAGSRGKVGRVGPASAAAGGAARAPRPHPPTSPPLWQ